METLIHKFHKRICLHIYLVLASVHHIYFDPLKLKLSQLLTMQLFKWKRINGEDRPVGTYKSV